MRVSLGLADEALIAEHHVERVAERGAGHRRMAEEVERRRSRVHPRHQAERGILCRREAPLPEPRHQAERDALVTGSLFARRDSADHRERGFVVRDGSYVTARWPGDAHRFAQEFVDVLLERSQAD